ncbi:transcriptional regulator, Fur family [Campylobacter blaseri]|uniref:Transcriptional repressor n=1 Tax=Campylobacter blaseri TaxID=2042961 RepID=A0A2P8QYZ9_9BACT|nr:transcriptional repressor [Campylobacter blaseri]PSM51469.1 transcriptional repressor [Campylobacter blaseri]PSM52918.1 transcriptional repressor [Campylobacter blaseri]QKF86525.1 transcriptional regulator, Fur family [Campylobacter blaseri]
MSNDEDFQRLLNIILGSVKKLSFQKEDILRILFYNEHLTAQDIQKKYKSLNKSSISLSTVYSALNYFSNLNLIKSIDHCGIKKYELNTGLRHDHLICIKCKKIINFIDKDIIDLQKDIGIRYAFEIHGHILLLEGICKQCQKQLK